MELEKKGKSRVLERGITLLLEVVVALEAGAEAIDCLPGLANPESDGVDRFAQRPHLRSTAVLPLFVYHRNGRE